MANMYISEYKSLAINNVGGAIQAGQEPAIAEQVVAFGAATSSAAFNAETKFVRISCDAEAFLLFGETATATATAANTGKNVQADTPEFFGVVGGHVVSAYDGTS